MNVYDFLEAHGTAYMVMELVHRRDAGGARLETRTPPAGGRHWNGMLSRLLAGLEKVHAADFLHRDIKPSNILIGGDDEPSLIDFGASRLALQGRTQAMTAIYTPGYAAFEQFTSARQGPWTDIYERWARRFIIASPAPPRRAPATG